MFHILGGSENSMLLCPLQKNTSPACTPFATTGAPVGEGESRTQVQTNKQTKRPTPHTTALTPTRTHPRGRRFLRGAACWCT